MFQQDIYRRLTIPFPRTSRSKRDGLGSKLSDGAVVQLTTTVESLLYETIQRAQLHAALSPTSAVWLGNDPDLATCLLSVALSQYGAPTSLSWPAELHDACGGLRTSDKFFEFASRLIVAGKADIYKAVGIEGSCWNRAITNEVISPRVRFFMAFSDCRCVTQFDVFLLRCLVG
jgi:hypothetical protein